MEKIVFQDTIAKSCCKYRLIRIDKPPRNRIVVPALQVILEGFKVEVVAAVQVGVGDRQEAVGGVLLDRRHAPRIVGVADNHLCILVQNGDNVALQVLLEVVGDVVVQNTKDGILVIVQGSKNVAVFLNKLYPYSVQMSIERTILPC